MDRFPPSRIVRLTKATLEALDLPAEEERSHADFVTGVLQMLDPGL